MKFGPVPVAQAAGLILAHSVQAGSVRLKKGSILADADIAALTAAGIADVTVAEPGADDVPEDRAAQVLGQALQGAHISLTPPVAGRVNLVAETDGVLSLTPAVISAINAVDEALTLATLPPWARVRKGMLLATVKIIPYCVSRASLDAAVAAVAPDALRLLPFKPMTYDLILTRTPAIKDSLLTKGSNAVQVRAAALGWGMQSCQTVDHTQQAVAEALSACNAHITLILGASATSDRKDVIPAALAAAGGDVLRFGMPVDPGNLLVLGCMGDRTVVGLPGCARSPALNGTDWVLERLAAGVPIRSADIAQMGVGGLLKEIPDRIQPRALRTGTKKRVAAVLLAAGASRRMSGGNKLLRGIDGVTLLRRSAQTLLGAEVEDVIVVIPPDGAAHRQALEGLDLSIIEAADAGLGMSASLRAGIAALPGDASAVLVSLADMPDLTADIVNCVIRAHDPSRDRLIVCPVDGTGRRGHPVLFDRRYLEALQALSGDRGARDVLRAVPDAICEVRLDAAVTRDLDTPQDWQDWEQATGRA